MVLEAAAGRDQLVVEALVTDCQQAALAPLPVAVMPAPPSAGQPVRAWLLVPRVPVLAPVQVLAQARVSASTRIPALAPSDPPPMARVSSPSVSRAQEQVPWALRS